MKSKSFTIIVKCFFCDSPLKVDMDEEYFSGDLIPCPSCAELNDYDALMDWAIEQGKSLTILHAEDEINKTLK